MTMSLSPHLPPRSPLSPRARLVVVASSALVGLASIGIAMRYSRAEPAPAGDPPGLTFGSGSVALAPGAPAWSSVTVDHPHPAPELWTDPVPARITFDETRTSRLGAPLGGRITKVFAETGQAVKRGAPLLAIASSSLAELHNDIAKADVELRGAKLSFERTQALVEAGSLPGKELVTAKQGLTEAELAGQLGRQKLASLQVASASESAFTLTAPRDGVIVEKKVAVGQQVDSGTGDLVAIADLSSVWVLADLFETDTAGVVPGARAEVSLDNGETQLDGEIAQVSAVVDPDRHTVPIRIRLANPSGALRPNAHAQVRLVRGSASCVVPASAVLSDGAKTYVYVAGDHGAMQRRDVVVAPVSSGVVPVISGISPADRVVVKGGILLDNAINLHDD